MASRQAIYCAGPSQNLSHDFQVAFAGPKSMQFGLKGNHETYHSRKIKGFCLSNTCWWCLRGQIDGCQGHILCCSLQGLKHVFLAGDGWRIDIGRTIATGQGHAQGSRHHRRQEYIINSVDNAPGLRGRHAWTHSRNRCNYHLQRSEKSCSPTHGMQGYQKGVEVVGKARVAFQHGKATVEFKWGWQWPAYCACQAICGRS